MQVTQRWRDGTHSWRRRSEGGFNPDQYRVDEVGYAAALEFVTAHHYSRSWPNDRLRYGLFDRHAGGELVGVAVLGVPMHAKVLTNPLPDLEPFYASLELSRLVLLDRVLAPAESWFVARAFRDAAGKGIRGVVAFSDPQPRTRRREDGTTEMIMPGHLGIVYQALGAKYCGLSTPSTQIHLPDGRVLIARSVSKIVGAESGQGGVVDRLVALGAAPPGEDRGKVWLSNAVRAVGGVHRRHRGNHRYVFRLGRTKTERAGVRIGILSQPYPKWPQALFDLAL